MQSTLQFKKKKMIKRKEIIYLIYLCNVITYITTLMLYAERVLLHYDKSLL